MTKRNRLLRSKYKYKKKEADVEFELTPMGFLDLTSPTYINDTYYDTMLDHFLQNKFLFVFSGHKL